MSRSTKKSQKPSVALSKVPSVKELCEQLGFQRASIKDTDTFMEATRAWRRSYKTSNDLPASHLLRWNDPAVQTELKAMAEKFLEAGDNGERFWGVSRNWYHPFDVQFPEEREKIVDLLMQLFWKQNKYAFNNSQYGHKQSESMEAFRDTSTPVREAGHFVDGKFIASSLSEMRGTPPTATSKVSNVSINNDSMIFSFPSRMVSEPKAKQSPQDRDIFEGPDDLDGSIKGSERNVLDESTEHDTAPTASKATSKRRREEGAGPPSTHENSTSLPSPAKKKKYHLVNSPRRTDRRRTQRNIPGAIQDDQVEEILREQEDAEILASEQAGPGTRPVDDREGSLRNRPVSGGIESLPKTPHSHTSPRGKTFSAPTAPMTAPKKGKSPISLPKTSRTFHHTSSPSKVRGKPPSNEVDGHPGLQKVEPLSKLSEFLSRGPYSKLSTGGTSSGRSEVVVISPIEDEEVTVSKSPFSQRKETIRDQPLPPTKATTRDPRTALSEEVTYPALAGGTQGGNEDDDINFQRTLLDSIAQAQAAGRTEIESSADPPERQDMEPRAKYAATTTTGYSDVRIHTETSFPQVSTENVDIKSPRDPTPQPDPRVSAQPQLPPQPKSGPQTTPSDPSSSKPRLKTQIPLWIITREPRYTEERWDDGKFSGTPLPAFIAGISQVTQRQNIEKVKLTLRTPMSDTKITVFKDAEDSWASAKETFVEKLKEARLEAKARRHNESLSCKILVEPFYEQSMLPSGSLDEDDEEFEF